jgi:hypothetical protein
MSKLIPALRVLVVKSEGKVCLEKKNVGVDGMVILKYDMRALIGLIRLRIGTSGGPS